MSTLLLAVLLLAEATPDRSPPQPVSDWPLHQRAIRAADAFAAEHPGRVIVVGIGQGDRSQTIVRGSRIASDPNTGPIDGDSLFEIGSVTKTTTGLLLAEAIERGEVTAGSTLGELRPDLALPDKVAAITLRQLATHTAGLSRDLPGIQRDALTKVAASSVLSALPVPGLAKWSAQRFRPLEPFVGHIRESLDGWLTTIEPDPPGTFDYSNLGQAILTDTLCRAADADYADLLADRVLRPAGMTAATLEITDENASRYVAGTIRGLEAPPWERSASLDGVGGLKASAHDMLAYGRAVLDPPPELAGAVDRATRTHAVVHDANGPERVEIGFGWFLRGLAGDRPQVLSHTGSTYAHSAYFGCDRKTGRVVVVFVNAGQTHTSAAQGLLAPRLGGEGFFDPVETLPEVDDIALPPEGRHED